ncbi:hypothetical protein GCM10011376_08810 [Nocardioides flavus (ex Wang et al. 2016)]|uniref:Uncharacterized protein n=1 Tax=Nocardioides flavus (ex Wang et al. 2016) TaxID=2058780 RepID=A0ABQ3HFA9_9ACTN|nr:hypothetical protein [Nocardioides flavus (ex Wang et al. 2016)]GHE16271.1 hypothetical protein GCM10011376_08810 [Nocardioides flavus (ex Wang et al. 2016)]
MSAQRRISKAASGRRQPWLTFWGASACVLAVCFLAVLRTSGTTSAGLVLLGGPIVLGIAAALFHSTLSPVRDSVAGAGDTRGAFESGGVGDADGGAGGGDSAG